MSATVKYSTTLLRNSGLSAQPSALESAGLAQRERSEADRRVVIVSATPAGKGLLERGRAARVRAIAALHTDATEAQLQTLRAVSDVIAARLTVDRS
jgi:DNA-binding MarR family transcriptional regulator